MRGRKLGAADTIVAMRLVLACGVLLVGACAPFAHQTGAPAARSWSPLAVSWEPERGWPARDYDIVGLRLGAIGARHHSVVGLDLPGLYGESDATSGGLAVGLVGNGFSGDYIGVQIAGVTNSGPYGRSAGACWGVQVSPFNAGRARGIQLGVLNGVAPTHDVPHNEIAGIQVGAWNGGGNVYGLQVGGLASFAYDAYGLQCGGLGSVAFAVRGLQAGAFTYGTEVAGLQVGLFNVVAQRGGLQLGLLNYNAASLVPWFPVFNFSW